jgi:hypothetical protein
VIACASCCFLLAEKASPVLLYDSAFYSRGERKLGSEKHRSIRGIEMTRQPRLGRLVDIFWFVELVSKSQGRSRDVIISANCTFQHGQLL